MNDRTPDSLLRRIAAGDFDRAADTPVDDDALRRYVARTSPASACERVARLVVTAPGWRDRYVSLVVGNSTG